MKQILTLLLIVFCSMSWSQNKVDSQGRKQGTWKIAYPHSNIFKYEGQFKDGKPIGQFIYYYESGRLQSVVNFKADGKTAYNVMYHESSGRVMAKGKYYEQKKDSVWVYFDNVGNLKSQENYKNGVLDGQQILYYEPYNGKYRVARSQYYKNGVKHGQYKEYYPNTKLKAEGNYVDGNFDGVVKFYYGNGNLERVERYKYAVKHGWWIFYDEEGHATGKTLFWEGRALKGQELEEKAALLKAEDGN